MTLQCPDIPLLEWSDMGEIHTTEHRMGLQEAVPLLPTHSVIFTHSLTYTHSLITLFPHSAIHSLTHSLALIPSNSDKDRQKQ